MKKMLILLIAVLGLNSCSINSNESYCYSSSGSAATAVDGPETGQVNQALTFNVSFKIGSSCGAFDTFATTSAFPKTITAVVNYEGCNCQALETTVTQQYVFTANAAGTYVLNFSTSDPEAPISKTVTITQ